MDTLPTFASMSAAVRATSESIEVRIKVSRVTRSSFAAAGCPNR